MVSKMDLDLFKYTFPQALIAQKPLPDRDLSRMMVLNRGFDDRGVPGTIRHDGVKNLAGYLQTGDLLVFNDTKVFPARLLSGKMEILLLEKTSPDETWNCLGKPLKKLTKGLQLVFSENLKGTVVANKNDELIIQFESQSFEAELEKIGLPPLPPYIQRKSAADYTKEDRERYQSIFAQHKGSAAAPTASLHFSENLLKTIKVKGIETASITLHVSRDTFLPIRETDIRKHKMHGERFHIPETTKEKIARTKKTKGRVIAVGTTVVRALESDWNQSVTTHYIYPGYSFKIVDGILTNFHQPGSTLILLVSAFAGREFLLQSYQEAISERYRLFSFGDCMLIL